MLFGGYLFGFSSFALAHEFGGHLNLTGVFIVPLIALALVRFVRGELGRRGLAVRIGVMLAVEFSISTEVTVTLTIMLIAGLVLAIVLLAEATSRCGVDRADCRGVRRRRGSRSPVALLRVEGPTPGPVRKPVLGPR